MEKSYWNKRYGALNTPWDIGYPSPAITNYLDQINSFEKKILIPGAGNAHEAEYAFKNGFNNTFVLDFASKPLELFEKRNPFFPKDQLLYADFFKHSGSYDLIIEQTFFCALPIHKRKDYVKKMHSLLTPKGKLIGLLFNTQFEKTGPPFGGLKEDYIQLFTPFFNIVTLETCYNSITPRNGNELFFIFENKT